MAIELSEDERRRLRSNVWKLTIFKTFIPALALGIPVIVMFWRTFGLTMLDIMVLQLVFCIALAVFEVPSGYLADCYGRAKTIACGSLAMSAGAALYLVSEGFWGFLVSEIFFAFGLSMLSGADQAILYDTLAELGDAKNFGKIWGRLSCAEMLGAAAYGIAGSMVYMQSPRLPYGIAALIFAGLFVLSLTLYEAREDRSVLPELRQNPGLKNIIRNHVLSSPRLMMLFLWSGVLVAALQCAFWLYQPYWEECGISVLSFGVLFALLNLVSALSAAYAHRLSARFGLERCLIVATVLLGVSFMLALPLAGMTAGALIVMVHQIVRGGMRIWLPEMINAEVPSAVRATVLSVRGLSDRAIYGLALLPMGLSADHLGTGLTYFWLGLLVIITTGSGAMYVLKRKVYWQKG